MKENSMKSSKKETLRLIERNVFNIYRTLMFGLPNEKKGTVICFNNNDLINQSTHIHQTRDTLLGSIARYGSK